MQVLKCEPDSTFLKAKQGLQAVRFEWIKEQNNSSQHGPKSDLLFLADFRERRTKNREIQPIKMEMGRSCRRCDIWDSQHDVQLLYRVTRILVLDEIDRRRCKNKQSI